MPFFIFREFYFAFIEVAIARTKLFIQIIVVMGDQIFIIMQVAIII